MKRKAVQFLVLATAMLLLPIGLLAHEDPHRSDTFSCVCHNPHKSLGKSAFYANLCISCHVPGMPDRARIDRALSAVPPKTPEYTYVRPFSYGDQANPYANDEGLNKSPNKTQTSHKWQGSDTVPEAGALPPLSKAMNPIYPNIPRANPAIPDPAEKPMLIGTLTCYRCHDLSVPRSSATNSAPFLRGLIDEDQMCVDCHRPRNSATHLSGTHPVNVRYSSVVAAKPDQYYATPVNSNPANPTSQLNTKKGKVVCSTCHGIHYTDSNSFTYDKYSSAVTRQFSTSKGLLLRTDNKRGSHTERNICTNCHRSNDFPEENPLAQVKNHNGTKNQNIQCTDCHGGHVEFAGYSTAAGGIPLAEKTPNVYLINRYMNISSPVGAYKTVRNAKVIFNDPNAKNYNKVAADGKSYGVCIVCHEKGLPPSVSQHTSTDANVCRTCHTHRQGFSASCNTCHGYPPVQNVGGGPDGYANTPNDYSAAPVYKNEGATPHSTHASGNGSDYSYSCDQCHKGFHHVDGNFQDVFIDTTGIIAGPLATYNRTAPGTCSSVYCHSDGAGHYKPVPWENGKGTIVGTPGECSACHNSLPDTATHPRHVAGGNTGKSYSCATCHAATVDGSGAIIGRSKHVDGKKDVAYSGDITACSSCHNDGKGGPSVLTVEKRKTDPAWDYSPADFANSANGACGTCHSDPMTNDAHPAHITAINGPQLVAPYCNACHVYTGELGSTHVDGTLQVVSGSCAPCHPGASPLWTGGSVTCESCHSGVVKSVIFGITAPDKSLASTLGHGKPSGANYECQVCHAAAAPHLNRDPAVHAFRLLTSLSSAANPNKACSYCHSDGTKVLNPKFRNMSTHFTVKGKADMTCWQCHDLHGTSNYRMIKTSFAYTNTTTWTITYTEGSLPIQKEAPYRGLCQVCHTKTKYYRAGVQELNHPDSNCYACHPHNTKAGAFAPFGSCDACHGYPPVPKSAIVGAAKPSGDPLYKQTFGTHGNYTSARFEDYSGGGGAHLWHMATTVKATDGWGPCAVCHSGGNLTPSSHVVKMPLKENISNVTVQIDTRFTFATPGFPSYSGAKLVNPPAVNQTGSCVNVACHFQPTPRWSLDR